MKKALAAMKRTFQVEGEQTVAQHGLSVFKYTLDILRVLKGEPSTLEIRVPSWLTQNREVILRNLVDYKTIKHYCLWHDIGKPFCRPDS